MSHITKKIHSSRGFTLFEVLISVFIMSVAVLAFQTAINTVFINRVVKNQDVGLRIASTEIENIRALTYSSLPSSGAFSDPLLSVLPDAQAQLTVGAYNSKTKQVTATVSWQDSVNKQRQSVSLTTLITQGGL